jgi:hypothetical protein
MELTMPPRMLSPSTFSQCKGCCRIREVYSEGRFQERNLRELTRHTIWFRGHPTGRARDGGESSSTNPVITSPRLHRDGARLGYDG